MYEVNHHPSQGVLVLLVRQATLYNAPPEDDHMSGRNMQHAYVIYNILSYIYTYLLVSILCLLRCHFIRHCKAIF
jgi:hypothetical protein